MPLVLCHIYHSVSSGPQVGLSTTRCARAHHPTRAHTHTSTTPNCAHTCLIYICAHTAHTHLHLYPHTYHAFAATHHHEKPHTHTPATPRTHTPHCARLHLAHLRAPRVCAAAPTLPIYFCMPAAPPAPRALPTWLPFAYAIPPAATNTLPAARYRPTPTTPPHTACLPPPTKHSTTLPRTATLRTHTTPTCTRARRRAAHLRLPPATHACTHAHFPLSVCRLTRGGYSCFCCAAGRGFLCSGHCCWTSPFCDHTRPRV